MIAQAGSSLMGLIAQLTQGQGGDNMLKNQRDAIRRQEAYTEASIDPNHPWAKALSGAIQQKMNDDAAQSVIANIINTHRARARGYTGAIGNNMRRDEANSSALAKLFMNSGLQARQLASQQLAQAGQQRTSLQWQPLNEQQMLQNITNQQNRYGMATGMPFMVNGLAELFSGMFGNSTTADGSTYGSDDRRSGMSPDGTMLKSYSGMLGGGV